MQRYHDWYRDSEGRAIPYGLVTVYNAGTTTLAAIYNEQGVITTPLAKSNPFTTDGEGYFAFAAAGGSYDISLSASNQAARTISNVALYDAVSDPNTNVLGLLQDSADPTHGDALVAVKQPFTGSVATTQHEFNSRVVSVWDFLSDAQKSDVRSGTKSLDCATAINAAIAYCKTLLAPRLVIPEGDYLCNSEITMDLPNGSVVECYGKIYSGHNGVAILVGSRTTNVFSLNVSGLSVEKAAVDTSNGSIGIQIRNTVWSNIEIKRCINFQDGVYVNATQGNGGVSYCQFTLGALHDNKINLHLTASGDGYTNENIFYGGSFNHSSSYPTSSTVNIQVDHYATHVLNNNRFMCPSLEDSKIGAVAASIQGGNNLIFHPRLEISATKSTSSFTGSISGGVLTLGTSATTTAGTGFAIGQALVGSKITPGTYIAALASGVLGAAGSTYTLGGITTGSVPSQAMTTTDVYPIVFETNSVECQLMGNGFSYNGHNIKDLGSNNSYQSRDGWVFSAQTTSGNPLLRLQSTASGGAHLIQGRSTTGSIRSYVTGDGFYFSADRVYAESGFRLSSSDGSLNDIGIFAGSGTPEGVVTAGVSSLFLRKDGGASTSLYVKQSGSGNTGWVAK